MSIRSVPLLIGIGVFVSTCELAIAADDGPGQDQTQKQLTMKDAQQIFTRLEGKWKGNCKTWFEPGKLADESPVEGKFHRIVHGGFLRHEYSSTIKGKPRTGDETLMFNPVKKKFESAWIDSFHMSYEIMFSEGDATKNGFFVVGKYDVAPNTPQWGWKTVYEIVDDDHLTITAFNISPAGEEAKAVEVEYTRDKE